MCIWKNSYAYAPSFIDLSLNSTYNMSHVHVYFSTSFLIVPSMYTYASPVRFVDGK